MNPKLLLPSLALLVFACSDPASKPRIQSIETHAISDITASSAQSGGTIIADEGAPIMEHGIAWSKSSAPRIETDISTIDGYGAGTFESTATALEPATSYHLRAYAVTEKDTVYGNELTFTTSEAPCTTTNTVFQQFYNAFKDDANREESVTMDLETHAITFSFNVAGSICAVGYQGIADNIVYTIEIADGGTVLYSGDHTFSSAATEYVSIPTIAIEANKSYIIRRTVSDWKGNISNTIGRLIKEKDFSSLAFPITTGSLTIQSTTAYGTGGPSNNKILPFIDFAFMPE